MNHVTTPLRVSAAGMRLAGYLIENNLRMAQIFGRAAVEANLRLVGVRLAPSGAAVAQPESTPVALERRRKPAPKAARPAPRRAAPAATAAAPVKAAEPDPAPAAASVGAKPEAKAPAASEAQAPAAPAAKAPAAPATAPAARAPATPAAVAPRKPREPSLPPALPEPVGRLASKDEA